MLKATTFGDSRVDHILAEHLNQNPDQAKWACRCVGKTVKLLHQLKTSGIQDKKFYKTVYNYIRTHMTEHVNSPPPHIHTKTKTFTANIIHRMLVEFYKERISPGVRLGK